MKMTEKQLTRRKDSLWCLTGWSLRLQSLVHSFWACDAEHCPGLAGWVRLEAKEEEGRAQGRTWSARILPSVAYVLWLGPTN